MLALVMPLPSVRFLRLLKIVLWSFFGVRREADAARDMEGVQPHMVLLLGVVVAAVFVVAIVLVVRLVTGTRPAAPAEAPVAQSSQPATTAVAKAHGPVVVTDTMDERVKPCTGCHGSATQASSDGFSPRIAGKPAGYLFNQLASFRDGRRSYPQMVYLVQYMGDNYLREMAAYFSRLELPYPPPEATALSPQAVARVRQIVEHGDAARGVPACTACHGASLTGTEPAIPGLLGLPRHYMQEQFGAWRTGRLRSVAPDCMAEVARRLAPEDVPSLAAWLAAQPVAPSMKPAAASNRSLPLQCGSVQAAAR
jgi:cytochrome c553